MKTLFSYLLFSIGLLLSAQNPGTLNPAFSGNGWDTIYGHNNGLEVHKALLQPDGKLLVTAEANFASEGHQAVLFRYNTNGTLDHTFGGGDGIIRTVEDQPENWPGEYLYTRASGTALQSNGKIIVAGDQFYNSERLLRFNPDGSLDTGFGIDGIVDMTRENGEFIYHVGVQSDDKIMVCGTMDLNVNGQFVNHVFLWRFLPNGGLDSTFGSNGVVSYTPVDSANIDVLKVNDLIVLPDNSLLVNQTYLHNTGSTVMLRKMTPNGAPDLSFGTAGNFFKTTPGFIQDFFSHTVVQNGAILFTLSQYDEATNVSQESIFRTNAQGQFDTQFEISLPEAPSNHPKQLVAHENIIYYWTKTTFGNNFDSIYSFDSNGEPITTFGENGMAMINQAEIPDSYYGTFTVANDGTIYGATVSDSFNGDSNFLTYSLFGADNPLAAVAQSKEKVVLVHPNPVQEVLHISTVDNRMIDQISVTDILGKTVLSVQNQAQINVAALAKGVYNVQVSMGKETHRQKIIKK